MIKLNYICYAYGNFSLPPNSGLFIRDRETGGGIGMLRVNQCNADMIIGFVKAKMGNKKKERNRG